MTTAIARNEFNRNRTGWKLLAIGLGMTALSGTAAARDNMSFSISYGVPAPIHAQVHVYSYAPPVYYTPPHVVYVPPRVVYYAAPGYAPKPRGHGVNRHWHKHHGRR